MQRGGGGLGAVLFTDIVGSTSIAAEMGNVRWSELVSRHHRIIRQLLARFGGREIDTAGDGFFATFDRPAAAIRCAVAAAEAVRELGIEIRSGVSFGELEVTDGKPSGLAVNTAARVMSTAGAGEVIVPASVREIVGGTSIAFEDRGSRRLKGLDRQVRLFRVTELDGAALNPPLEVDESAGRRREIFPAGGSRRTALAIGAVVGAIAVIVGISLLASSSEGPGPETEGPRSLKNTVVKIDPESGALTKTRIPLGREPTGQYVVQNSLAAGEGGLWILSPPLLFHLDPLHADVRREPITVGYANLQDVWTGLDAVWVIGGPETLWKVNAATDEAASFLESARYPTDPYTMALGDAVWVGRYDGTLVKVDPRTGARKEKATGYSIDRLATTTDRVWLVDIVAGVLVPVDPVTMKVGEPVEVDGVVDEVDGRGDTLWILDKADGIVERRDAVTGKETGRATVGNHASDMSVDGDSVWVGGDGYLARVDPLTLDVTTFPMEEPVLGVAVDADGSVWAYFAGPTTG